MADIQPTNSSPTTPDAKPDISQNSDIIATNDDVTSKTPTKPTIISRAGDTEIFEDGSIDLYTINDPLDLPSVSARRHISHNDGSVKTVISVALPLILASSSQALMTFADRVMLQHYSEDAFNASLYAGNTNFTLMALFIGTAGYTGTFVAQYAGARKFLDVGRAVWQGIWLALIGGIYMLIMAGLSGYIFDFIGHDTQIRQGEVEYFRIISVFGFLPFIVSAMSSFWGGRGKTWVVFGIQCLIMITNVFCNWLFIYGNWGCPKLGITGAAIGTVIGSLVGLIPLAFLFFAKNNRTTYGTWPKKLFDRQLFLRLVRFGLPNGFHMFLDVGAFSVFALLMGHLGGVYRTSTSIALSVNMLAILPIIGLSGAVSILVGQAVGAKNIPVATRSVKNAGLCMFIYSVPIILLYILLPDYLILAFSSSTSIVDGDGTVEFTKTILLFVSAYFIFDAMFFLYGGAVKGAGDTRWVMIAGIITAWGILGIPQLILHSLYSNKILIDSGDTQALLKWTIMIIYMVITGLLMSWRYYKGKWKQMSVIEHTA